MSQEFEKSFGFKTGSICAETNLYRCSNGIFEVIEYVAAGQPFPSEPWGTGKNKTNWLKVTLATDGNRKTFDGGNAPSPTSTTIGVTL